MDHNSWRKEKMSDADLLMECSKPWTAGDTIEAKLTRAARRIGIGYWRAWNVRHGKARLTREEYDRAEAYRLKTTQDLEVLRDEYRRGLQILVGATERFAAIDPDFYRTEIDLLRDLAGSFPPTKDCA